MKHMLIAAYKPPFISSNAYLSSLKKRFNVKKGGYLGTLDPFAKGTLVVGFGSYTRLFPHLQKTPKTYKATLWLGAYSKSLDIEHIESVQLVSPYAQSHIKYTLDSIRGRQIYTPPLFSAKHIQGKRAYQLARAGIEATLKPVEMEIYHIKLLSYAHPFVHFEVSVSQGAYVRSIGEIIARKLHTQGTLSSLERVSEGAMSVNAIENIKILNPLDYLPYTKLYDLSALREEIYCGKKLTLKSLQKGKYIVCFDDFFSIIEVCEYGRIKYILNRMAYVNSLAETR